VGVLGGRLLHLIPNFGSLVRRGALEAPALRLWAEARARQKGSTPSPALAGAASGAATTRRTRAAARSCRAARR
jgi:hypothetical protein